MKIFVVDAEFGSEGGAVERCNFLLSAESFGDINVRERTCVPVFLQAGHLIILTLFLPTVCSFEKLRLCGELSPTLCQYKPNPGQALASSSKVRRRETRGNYARHRRTHLAVTSLYL